MNLSKGKMIENHKILKIIMPQCACASLLYLRTYLSVNVFNKNAFQYFYVS